MKILLLMTSLGLFGYSGLANASTMDLPAQLSDIDKAANSLNIEGLQQLTNTTQDYANAYANYRLAISANVMGQKSIASDALSAASHTLESLIERQADVEYLSLLVSVYGMQIALDSSKGATLGLKSSNAIKRAEALDAHNPRLILVKAISAFSTPIIFGGSMQNALTYSNKAISAFNNPCNEICWGEAEAYTWRGLAKQALGDTQGATQDWLHALQIQPDYGWATFLLQQDQ